MNEDNIELRSEELQEIIGRMPSRIERYGIIVIACVVLVIFVGSFFFKYPDTLDAKVVIDDKCSYAYAYVPSIANIRKGQNAIINLDNFPEEEYGYLLGKVVAYQTIPNEQGMYVVRLKMDEKWNGCNAKESSVFRYQHGIAKIILKIRRGSDLFTDPIKRFWQKQAINNKLSEYE